MEATDTRVIGSRTVTDGFAHMLAQVDETRREIEMEEESGLVRHARRELELYGNDEAFNECIIKTMRAFASYGHSNKSASAAIPILNALLKWKALTPLTNDPHEWVHHDEERTGEESGIWQNLRDSEAFSDDGGQTYYLLSNRDEIFSSSTPTVAVQRKPFRRQPLQQQPF